MRFKLMFVNSNGESGDAEDKHLRSAGYVPAVELTETQLHLNAANTQIKRFRSGLKCQDWVRIGWADAILFLEKIANHAFSLHAVEDEARKRFMLGPDDPIRPGNTKSYLKCGKCGNVFPEGYYCSCEGKAKPVEQVPRSELDAAVEVDRRLRVCLKAVTEDWDHAARALAREARAQPASSPLAQGKSNRAEAFEIAAAAVRRALDDFPPHTPAKPEGCVECGNDFAEGYCPHKKEERA